MTPFWIPGWQFTASAFQPLWSALEFSSPPVLPYAESECSLDAWLDMQAARLPEQSVLVGWSLGGMLACELARRSSNVKRVFVLCANTQFSGGPGLPEAIAEPFRLRYQNNPAVMRKKFAALVSREQASMLPEFMLQQDCAETLDWLYDLTITDCGEAQVHVLLAEEDQLVPVVSAQQAWAPIADSVTVLPGEHGLPFSDAASVAQWIAQYE